MNMKKKVMLIFNLIIFVLNILVVPIYATSKANLEFTITANKEEVYGGDEVEITLRLEDYENVEKGLNAYTATIDYDENIFEKISASNFVSLNNWESLEYNPENKSFVAIKKAGTSEAEDVVTIKLKVKENVTGQDTEIKFKNFATSKGKYDIEKPEEKKIIHIIEESSKLPDNDSSNDNQKPDDNKNNDNNTVGSTDGTNNNTVNNSADKTNNNTVANSTDKTNNNIVANSTDKTNNNTVANSTDKTNNTVANKTDGNNSSNNTVVGSTDESKNNSTSGTTGGTNNDSTTGTTGGSNNGGTTGTTGTSNNGGTTGKIDPEEATKKDTSTSSQKLPYTGLSIAQRWIIIVVIVLVCISIAIKIRASRIVADDEDVKKIINSTLNKSMRRKQKIFEIVGVVAIVGILTTELSGIVKAVGAKGEVNGDGNIDYADVTLIEKHIVSLAKINDDRLENADINDDRYITVTDLSLLIQKIEKKLDYKVEISNLEMSNYYPQKGEEITLKFDADVNYGAEIEKVVINNKEYSVVNNGGNYEVTLTAPKNAGVQTFEISKAILDVGKTVDISYNTKIDILKEIPSIENYEFQENAKDNTLTIKFDIIDEDNSITSGSIVVTDEDSNQVASKEVSKGENKVTFNAEETKEYKVTIDVDYDLDDDEFASEEDHTGALLKEETVKYAIEYDLKFSNLKIYNSSNEEANTFEKQSKINLVFDSENAENLDVQSVVIDGNKYEVVKLESGKYEAKIDAGTATGEKEIVISEVVLENGKAISLTENNTAKVIISKVIPTVENVKVAQTENKLSVKLELADEDNAIQNATIIVTDENDKVIFQEELKESEYEKEIDVSNEFAKAYNVKVIASYDIATDAKEDEVLYEEVLEANTKIKLEEASLEKSYVEKDESFKITYKVQINNSNEIEKVRINNQEVEVKKIDSNTYEVELQAPSTSGKIELNTTKFLIGEDEFELENQNEIEVLKSNIAVEDYEATDNVADDTVSIDFNVVDSDNAFVSGKVQLVKNETEEVTSEKTILDAGENSFTFDVEEDVEYTLKVLITENRYEDDEEKAEEKLLLEKTIQFIKDYQLKVENLRTLNEEGEATSYFAKGEKVKLAFDSTNATKFYPEYVVVNGTKYPVVKNENEYTLELTAEDVAGMQTFSLDKIFMNNAKEFDIDSGNLVKIEVLKDKPKVENFAYEKTNDDKISMSFDLVDDDNSFESAKIKVQDENNKVLKEEEIALNKNTVEFDLTTSEKYKVTIFANYDLDTNALDANSNHFENDEIFTEEIVASKDVIELKDISKITLYHKAEDSSLEEIEELNLTYGIPTDLDNYYAKIEMEDLPTYYANIKEIKKDEDKASVVIDQEEFVEYEENEDTFERKTEFSFDMAYVDSEGEHSLVTKANSLFEEMAKNLSGTYELTEDLDASSIDGTYGVAGTFKGTLNGNGYKIINLPTVLFEKLNNATITNLIIEEASITNDSKAILANAIENNSTIENVHIVDSKLSNNQNGVGAITGGLTNSIVKNCSVTQVSIKANNTIGGICGQMSSGSTVEDCYVTGTLQGTISHNLGTRTGGITGWDSGTLINHCYTVVNIIAPSTTGNGGIIGGPNGLNPKITNSVSMSTGNAYKIAGFNTLANSENVYEYSMSNATTNINDDNKENVKTIENIYDKSFYKDTLGFDETIWNLSLVDEGKLPNLISDPMPNTLSDYELMENKNSIPNYEELRSFSNYKKENEILYYNMSRLMPYAETTSFIEYGNSISSAETIGSKRIDMILALDENSKVITGINANTLSNIAKIRVVYEDKTSEEFTVEYSKTLENLVAIYKIKELNIPYEFDGYISSIDESMLSGLVEKANNYDYAEKISAITTETESRLYTDYYNESVKSKVKEIIENYIMSNEDFATYNKNAILQKQITDYMTEENVIKLLYSYNYYDKWYHIDFDGIILSDVMFFEGNKINKELTEQYLIDSVCNTTESVRKTSATTTFYSNFLQGKTGSSLSDFLASMMAKLNGYTDPNDWFVDHFDGILVEQKAYGASDEVMYRIWDLMSRRSHLILPVLTAPQEDMYMISVPSQIVLGSMNRYDTYLTKDGGERQRMEELIRGYSEKIGNFYGTTAGILSNATQVFNSRVNIQYDTRFYFPASDKADAGTQDSGTTKDPVMKWVYEAIGSWGAANGSGAYANGTDVYWIVYQALGGDFSFSVFAHETAHNQDGAVFYGGAGRRNGTGAESHSDGNIRQEYGNGIMVFNFSYDLSITEDYTNNFSYKTINTPESIYKYYKEMFEVRYVLDYLEAQAFLRLTPEEQAKVAVQAVETSDGGKSMSTAYTRLTAEDFENMNLQTMEDLWDNQICIRAVGTSTTADAYNYNQYGYESYYCVNWYQPHNDTGVTDCYSFKRLGQEMLGVAGYENGYIVWMSGKSSNDLDALRKITGDDDITFKEYKLGRYETVKENLSKISYFDYNEVIDEFEANLKTDGANNNLDASINTQSLLYGIVKRATSDFTDGGIYEAPTTTSITSAKQLVDLANSNTIGNYRLDADIDFTGIEVEEGEASYITNQFIGILDGNGHKITGVKYPLFKSMLYADVKNITIENPEYVGAAEATIALSSSNSVIDTINVKNSNLELPFIKTKSNRYYAYGTNETTVGESKINSLDDFLEIGTSEVGRKKRYVLNVDLDLSSVTNTSQPILPVTFIGKLNGNGHTISNVNATLFTGLSNATIENLKIENGSISGTYAKGILANTIEYSTISKVSISGITLASSGSNGVGGLSGGMTNGSVTEVSLENITITANNTIGGLAGQINGTTVENCIVTGSLTGTEWQNGNGARIGGITGWLSSGSLNNCLTKVNISSSKITGNGGIIGGPTSGNRAIKNSISLSTGEKAYRLAGWTETLGGAENVYEYAESNSTTNITDSNSTQVKVATAENVKDINFYKNNLGWSEDIWDFTDAANGGVPTLKIK